MKTRLQWKLWIQRFVGLFAVALLVGCGTSGDGGDGTGVSAAVRVSGTPTIGGLGSVDAFAWAPDSSRIAYLARQETTAQELFSTTPESDADNVKVSGPLTGGANVELFAWSPNPAITNRIAYLADQDKINVPELYTSRPDGTENQNVSGPLDSGGRVSVFFEWVPPSATPDTLIFLASKDDFAKVELYASFDNGLSITRLSDPLIDGGNVVDFAISPDGQLVAYKADAEFNGRFELFTVPIGGGTVINVSRQFDNVLNVIDFAWAPDGSRIAFTAQNDRSGNTGGNIELYTNRPRASNPFRVSIRLPVNGNVRDFQWSPNRLLLVYAASTIAGSPDRFLLFSTRPDSQDNRQISGFLRNRSTVGAFAWSPNGRRVAFLVDFSSVGVNELLLTDPTAVFPSPVVLSGSLVAGGEVVLFEWAPDGSRIAYLADQFEDEKFELISVFPDSANPSNPNVDLRRLSGRDLQGDVVQFAWAPDASRIAYIADQEVFGVFELFTNTPRGNSNRKVSGELVRGGEVKDFAWAPNSALIAYQANQDNVNIDELYTTGPR